MTYTSACKPLYTMYCWQQHYMWLQRLARRCDRHRYRTLVVFRGTTDGYPVSFRLRHGRPPHERYVADETAYKGLQAPLL